MRTALAVPLLSFILLSSACVQPISGVQDDGGVADGGGRFGGGEDPYGSGACTDLRVPQPPARFAGVKALGFGSGGRLYVLSRTSSGTSSVQILGPAPDHEHLRTIADDLGPLRDLAVSGAGDVYVLAQLKGEPAQVHVYDAAGAKKTSWARPHGTLDCLAIAVDRQDRVHLGCRIIERYTAAGDFLDTIGKDGFLTGQIGGPRAVGFDARDDLWVADLLRNALELWSSTTRELIIEIGGRGAGDGRFDEGAPDNWAYGPNRFALDAEGNLYANDPFASRIQKLTPQGGFLGKYTFGGSTEVGPIAIEPASGRVLVGRSSEIDILCPL